MNHPRRVCSPQFGYDPRAVNRVEPRPNHPTSDYDDPYAPSHPFEPTQAGPTFMEPHPQYPGYRDSHLPSTYRATLREHYPVTGSAPYKILCITNLNPKVSDSPVKDALTNDFSRFGDVSVSICNDGGERLAYIYFKTYEEAREARHSKAKSLLFDRPIEIEPIYEPPTSPMDSPPPVYPRRNSITPTDYFEPNSMQSDVQRSSMQQSIPHHRPMSPQEYIHTSRYPPGPSPPTQPASMPYGRYYVPQAHMTPLSPYSSPPHDPFRSYAPHPESYHSRYQYPASYGPPPMARERDRSINDEHLIRSPRHESYYPTENRSYAPVLTHHSSRGPPASYSNSSQHHHHNQHQNHHHHHPHQQQHHHQQQQHQTHHHHSSVVPNAHQSSSSSYRSPPQVEHPRYMPREHRRDKFDVHNTDQDESRPSRVLIVNNIDSSKSELDIRNVFGPFGIIEDIEVKKIAPDLSSALIKFSSMDAAYKAKTATNGRYIGSAKCRVIYGKVNASRRLWIGGLSPTSTLACLEDEVSKFGSLVNVDYTSGRPYAYVEYESANQAQFAAYHLRSTLVPAPDRKIRIEFVDPERSEKIARLDPGSQASEISSRPRATKESWTTNELDPSPQSSSRKRSRTPNDIHLKKARQDSASPPTPGCAFKSFDKTPSGTASKVRSISDQSVDNNKSIDDDELNNNQDVTRRRIISLEEVVMPESPAENHESIDLDNLAKCTSIRAIVQWCSVSWSSHLVLRNFIFPSRIFMCSGTKSTIDKYLTSNGDNGDSCSMLRITQRWRLHPQPKLEEVKRRMQSGNLGMLIITSRTSEQQASTLSSPICKTPQSTSNQHVTNGEKEPATSISGQDKNVCTDGTSTSVGETSLSQTRPLKNLISYLEQKDAAGVVSLSSNDQTDGIKLLYTFPPGEFALNLLKRIAPSLGQDTTKEEFLLGVIVGGNAETTKI